MKPSEECKNSGLKSLDELAELSGESVQNLISWHKVRRFRFKAILKLALEVKGITNATPYKFKNTYCSSCGGSFGPGDSGFSHCEDHKGLIDLDTL